MSPAIIERSASIPAIVKALAGVQKSAKGAPAYSRFVNRPLGRWFAATAYKLGMSPNGVTGVSALFSFTGIALLVILGPTWLAAILVTLMLVIGYALDSADGQLARLQGGGSTSGEWLDHVIDAVKISTLHLAVLVALFRAGDVALGWLWLPIIYVVTANLFFFAYILGDMLKRQKLGGKGKSAVAGADDKASVLRSLMTVPTDYGLLAVSFLLWGMTPVFLVVYGILLLGNIGYVALGLPKWYGDMNALDREVAAAKVNA